MLKSNKTSSGSIRTLFLVVALFVGCGPDEARADWNELDISVVRILEKNTPGSYGTGLLVAHDSECKYYVTNYHVLARRNGMQYLARSSDDGDREIQFVRDFREMDLSVFCIKSKRTSFGDRLDLVNIGPRLPVVQGKSYIGGAVGYPGSASQPMPMAAYHAAVDGQYRSLIGKEDWYPYRLNDGYVYDRTDSFEIKESAYCPILALERCLIVPFTLRGFSGSPFIASESGTQQQRVIGIVSHYDPLLPQVYIIPMFDVLRHARAAIEAFRQERNGMPFEHESFSSSVRLNEDNCLERNGPLAHELKEICTDSLYQPGGGAVGVGGGGAVGVGGGGAVGVGGGGALHSVNINLLPDRTNIGGIVSPLQDSGFLNYGVETSLSAANQGAMSSGNWWKHESWLKNVLNANTSFRGALDVLLQSPGLLVRPCAECEWRLAFSVNDVDMNTLQEAFSLVRDSQSVAFGFDFAFNSPPGHLTSHCKHDRMGSLRVMEVVGQRLPAGIDSDDDENVRMSWLGRNWGEEFFRSAQLKQMDDSSYELEVTNVGDYRESVRLFIPELRQIGPDDYFYAGDIKAKMNIYRGAGFLPLKIAWGNRVHGTDATTLKSIVRLTRMRDDGRFRISAFLADMSSVGSANEANSIIPMMALSIDTLDSDPSQNP